MFISLRPFQMSNVKRDKKVVRGQILYDIYFTLRILYYTRFDPLFTPNGHAVGGENLVGGCAVLIDLDPSFSPIWDA